MSLELELLDRLRAERMALLRERGELLMRGSEAMRAIRSLRAAGPSASGPVLRRVAPLHEPPSPGDRGGETGIRSPAFAAPAAKPPAGDVQRAPFKPGPADLA